MDFPHLKDTAFPLIDNVNVYKYQNNFDYARWQGKVSYKLMNVKWNSNYADVPYFETVEERDNWFDTKDGIVGTLESAFNNTPKNTLKVPLPYNDMYHCNYLMIDMPVQTSIDNPINYGNEDLRIKRWFFFIEDMEQFAPNTTELHIVVDYWTTFIHTVQIPYLMLERGHAPMMQITPDKFLANPIMNNEYLLAPDFNYGKDSIIQTSTYKPIGNGTKYVLFCAPYHKDDFSKFNSAAWSGNSTPPTYANQDNRWGHQLTVNGYAWKYDSADYSNADLPITNMVQSGILNGCECYAIEGSQAKDFFNDCAKNCVQFIHGIKAMFILDEALFTKSDSFTFRNKTLYIADGHINTTIFSLNKAAFGFDSKYSEITKLYTSPYSILEITDDNGTSFEFKIENCGQLKMHEEVSLIFPFLNYNVFFSGINGDGTMQYIWKSLKSTNDTKTMWASDFSKFMMNWKVPTYEIYVSAENEYAVNHAADMETKRAGAIKDYQNAVRYANTTYENTSDTMSTNTANVAATGVMNNENVATQNAANTTITTRSNTAIRNNTDTAMEANLAIKNANNTKIEADYNTDNNAQAVITMVNNEVAALSTAANQAASIVSGVTGSVVQGSPLGIVNVGIDAASVGACTSLSISNSNAVSTIVQTVNRDKGIHAVNTNNTVSMNVRKSMSDQADENIDKQSDNTSTQNAADATKMGNIVATNNSNAVRTQNTETNNADYTRDAVVAAEKANLVQKQLEAENAYKNARLHLPYEHGVYSGDFAPDAYKRRGIRFNVRTQPKSAIAQAGDAMLRFGYALHRVWDMSSGFHYGRNFTFWKAEDIWINDGTGVANAATDTIANILLSGVTVWRDASKIGTVGIYDNI